jgi:hypothetical protein
MATKLAKLTHKTAIQQPSGRELYHLQFSLQAASQETFGYTLGLLRLYHDVCAPNYVDVFLISLFILFLNTAYNSDNTDQGILTILNNCIIFTGCISFEINIQSRISVQFDYP